MSFPQVNVLRIATSGWPPTLNPQKASLTNELSILALNYEGLTRLDKNLTTIPAAAESWCYDSDATTITFRLREGLTYSDGSPLQSSDFAAAIRRALDPWTPGNYQTLLAMIEGAEAIINMELPVENAKLNTLFRSLGIKTPDERTLIFVFTRPTPYFHTLASTSLFYPARQDLIDQGEEQWHTSAPYHLGNGPFQLVALDQRAQLMAFEANRCYWCGMPSLAGIQLLFLDDKATALDAYQRDEVDIVAPDPRDIAQIRANSALSRDLKECAGSCTMVLEFALHRLPFNQKPVREAFSCAFDRDAYIHDMLHDAQAKTLTWIPPACSARCAMGIASLVETGRYLNISSRSNVCRTAESTHAYLLRNSM